MPRRKRPIYVLSSHEVAIAAAALEDWPRMGLQELSANGYDPVRYAARACWRELPRLSENFENFAAYLEVHRRLERHRTRAAFQDYLDLVRHLESQRSGAHV